MTRKEKNEEIAKILGFEKVRCKCSGWPHYRWNYPEDWQDEVVSWPQHSLPDFVGMIETSRKINNIFRYGLPKQYEQHDTRKAFQFD